MLSRPEQLESLREEFEQKFNVLKNTFLMWSHYWRKLVGVVSLSDHGRVQDKLDKWLGFKRVVAHFRQIKKFPEYRDWYYGDYAKRFHTDGAWVVYCDAAYELYEKEFREHEVMAAFIRQLVQSNAYKQLQKLEKKLYQGIALEDEYEAQRTEFLSQQWQVQQRMKEQRYQAKCRQEQSSILQCMPAKALREKVEANPLRWEYATAQQDNLHRVKLIRKCVSHIDDYFGEMRERLFENGRKMRAYHLKLMLRVAIQQYKRASASQKQQVYAKLIANVFLHYCSIDDVNSQLSKAVEQSLLALLRVEEYPPLKEQQAKSDTIMARVAHLYHALRRALFYFLPGSEKVRHPFTDYLAKKIVLQHAEVVDVLLAREGDTYKLSQEARRQLKQLQEFDHQEVSVFAKSAQLKIVTFNHCLNITNAQVKDTFMQEDRALIKGMNLR